MLDDVIVQEAYSQATEMRLDEGLRPKRLPGESDGDFKNRLSKSERTLRTRSYSQMVSKRLEIERIGTKVWVAHMDERTRGSHAELHGQEVPVSEPFVTRDGALLMYPGDPSGPDEEVFNCRCILIGKDDPSTGSTFSTAEEDEFIEWMQVDGEQVRTGDLSAHGRILKKYSPEEREALQSYVSSDTFFDIREAWREGKAYPMEDGTDVFKLLDKASKRYKTQKPTKLYRALHVRKKKLDEMRAGSDLVHDFYISTSADQGMAQPYGAGRGKKANVIMELLVPGGVPIMPGMPDEWVFPPDTEMKVRRAVELSNGTLLLKVDVGIRR